MKIAAKYFISLGFLTAIVAIGQTPVTPGVGTDSPTDIARKMGLSVAGVFYRFCIQEGITVLDGTTSEEHMLEDLAAATNDKYALSEEDMANVRKLLR